MIRLLASIVSRSQKDSGDNVLDSYNFRVLDS